MIFSRIGECYNMHGVKEKRGVGSIAITVLVVLAIALLLGFLLDFVITQIEYLIFPKPQEYQGYVTRYSSEFGVPENLVFAVIKTESGFDPAAVSDKGAVGLMQLTETTFADIRDRIFQDGYMDAGMRYDPETNIKYGVRYLAYLYARFGHWETAIIAYFEGETRVEEWLENKAYDKNSDGILDSLPKGYRGGQEYLNKVKASWNYYDKLY
jgi:soluble lytic murein transglycosylase